MKRTIGVIHRPREYGSAMLEFILAGIASVCLTICTVAVAYGMWNYHTLAYAVHEATRYAAVHGKGCTDPGNNCSVTVGSIMRKIAHNAIGISAERMLVRLSTDSGAQMICNPITACYSSPVVWPPSSNDDNQTGKKITVEAQYQFRSALLYLWPGARIQRIAAVNLPAASTQTIIF